MDEEAIVYLLFSAMVYVLIIANVNSFGGGAYTYLAITLALIGAAFLLVIMFADFIIFPAITGLLGITFQPYPNYKITKGQEAIIKNVNGLYYATGFVTGNLFSFTFKAERVQEDEDEKQLASLDTWERAMMSIGFPFKFHVMSAGLDVQQVRDDLEGKRSYQEFQLSRSMQNTNVNESIIAEIQRKINVIQARIDRISQDEKPIATLMYIETTAVGVSEKAAMDALSAQIKQLQIARAFGFTRSFGGTMIALGLGLGFVFPLVMSITYGYLDMQIIQLGCAAGLGGCTGTLFSSMVSAFAGLITGSGLLLNGSWIYQLAALGAGLTFIPFLNFTLVETFVADFSKAIGEKLDFTFIMAI